MSVLDLRESLLEVPPSISVFGQTWLFSAPAIATLNLYGLASKNDLMAFIINNGTLAGIDDGTYEVTHLGIQLQLIVGGGKVIVVDPYYQ